MGGGENNQVNGRIEKSRLLLDKYVPLMCLFKNHVHYHFNYQELINGRVEQMCTVGKFLKD